jgi:Ser/Thr protein kinase RdoA (MazF antagonist)
MAFDLDEDGWFNNNDMSLCHLDFEPRNILIDLTRDPDRPIMGGILDWDGAVLAPSLMACALPMCLLAWADDEVEDERKANDVPSSK